MANIKQSSHRLQRTCQWTLTSHWTALWKGEGSLIKINHNFPPSPYPYSFSVIIVCLYYSITWKSHSGLEPCSARFCINTCEGTTFARKNEYPQSPHFFLCDPSPHINVGITTGSCLSCYSLNQRTSKRRVSRKSPLDKAKKKDPNIVVTLARLIFVLCAVRVTLLEGLRGHFVGSEPKKKKGDTYTFICYSP